MLSDIAIQIGGKISGPDTEFFGFSSDTRSLEAGDLYVALTGETFDGNNFVEEAVKKGAVAAIVSKDINYDFPHIKVSDVHLALGKIASLIRKRSKAFLIAVTGSQGKTTVKEMIGSILSINHSTLVTKANFNNTIGVPLTLLQLEDHHNYAVIEMGADCHGEVEFSAVMARPDIALITNANEAHVEGFGSLQGIVEAKGEIIDPTIADGKVILNADDRNVKSWISRAGNRSVVQFSQSKPSAGYFASNIHIEAGGQVSFVLNTPDHSLPISLHLLGNHNVINAVGAAAAALEAGVELDQVKLGLESLMPVSGRLAPLFGLNECRVLDDTYNASPSSFKAAIDVLASFAEHKILLAGDMRELGAEAKKFHEEIGKYAFQSGINELLAVGKLSTFTAEGFGSTAKHFETMEALIDACRLKANSSTTFLIKGSRGSEMELVVNSLRENGGA